MGRMEAEIKYNLEERNFNKINNVANHLLIVTAGLNTEGCLLRIADRDPAAVRLLRLNFKNPVFNDVIKKNLREEEENFPRRRFNPNNRMRSSLPTYNNNNYNSSNAYNAFRSGFNANNVNNNKGQFFQDGGADDRQADPSEVLTSPIPRSQKRFWETGAPRNEGVLMD
jgi:hypothetical protein